MKFEIFSKDTKTKARAGELTTDHGKIQTPIFMPVGTVGSVKGVNQRDLIEDVGAQIILGNTYHLYLRPGVDTIKMAGGLHKFMNWNRPILTDSGGYQVFSLAENRKLKDEGAHFSSHIDGSKHLFTPENIVDIQRIIGADIVMAFDECTPFPCEYTYAKKSMELTHRWLARGLNHFDNTESLYGYNQTFFPIVQGSVFDDLRQQSAKTIASFERDGYAIGGLSVGEPVEQMYDMIDVVNEILPENKPRYLMGVGTPANILEGIARGIDMFDCVMPTRNGRNGMLFTRDGVINIKNVKWKNDFSPIEENGASFVDSEFSKAYLRHLIVSKEILGAQIASLHNLAFYLWLVTEARTKIIDGTFTSWKNEMLEKLSIRL
ncbi:MAG: tRNA guanosine(34) transglycosylase Tgt [Bacteroidetes bacterium GWC2_33_15]|nr:MAG: tRNA guanosine(34) transglycosylase Tgt [Bacteroidetes bacterium GWA2_33_15]OFX49166.1 MAG: tRNA guanosine(34) transglycosylase Tgt [Bacteroidetes bacterium GWC2_33_15]OFX64912.1 MAG: tRNA guanosine(34) transglycosylase Tgt [Bacteroidetes bacterium GWB2_32_14]OFX68620.1 MAG: tRNA guanosine(34) transglycosylase Tgt [Bacteroidetes bacterium GWD2_33_33]HAN17472.1 tRNA guanosine(34) transglycosylase Tgt [Bacteroidales bacterium]